MRVNDAQFEREIESILEDMCARLPIQSAGPQVSSVASSLEGVRVALNKLGEELQASLVTKERYELLFNELEVTHSQLRQATEFVSIGQLAAEVADQLSQPLKIIGFAVDELRDALLDADREAAEQCVDGIEAQVERGAGVVGRLLAFGRGQHEPTKSLATKD
jgi:phosphoglycerate-specific signal transduction histidine kinase